MRKAWRIVGSMAVIVGLALATCFSLSSCGRRTHNEVAGPSMLKARANELGKTVVTPHLEQRIAGGKNVLWCSTFQLAWNEYCKLQGGNLSSGNAKSMASILNKMTATKNDLDKSDYVAAAGILGQGIIEKIEKELEKKFQGQADPELLRSAKQASPGDPIAYSYLFKALRFEYAFLPFKEPLRFDGKKVASFGTADDLCYDDMKERLVGQVGILDYVSDDDFVIELKTPNEKDRLILAKTSSEDTLEKTVAAVLERARPAKPSAMQLRETLQVPVLNFDILREYDELYQTTPLILALQSIRFRLDRNGAVLKSEAVGVACLSPEPKELVLDEPFLILMMRRGAKNPYFALWVDNAELLVPFYRESKEDGASDRRALRAE